MRLGHRSLAVLAASVATLTAPPLLAQPATIVGVDGTFACVLGAAAGPGSWLPSGNAPLSIGESLVPITLAGLGAPLTVASLSTEPELCSKTQLVTFDGEGMPPGFVAMPDFTGDASVTRLAPDQAVYRTVVVEALAGLGLPNAQARIVQLLRTDLEGDGRDEVVIVAERGDKLQPQIEAGDYSLVLVRRLDASGAVQTVTLAQEIYPEGAEFAAPSQYRIHAIADLDGDGVREIVMGSRYYEGAGVSIIGIAADGTPTVLAGCACGA
jgi:hypothetical protein